jgi:hypothetical protein
MYTSISQSSQHHTQVHISQVNHTQVHISQGHLLLLLEICMDRLGSQKTTY